MGHAITASSQDLLSKYSSPFQDPGDKVEVFSCSVLLSSVRASHVAKLRAVQKAVEDCPLTCIKDTWYVVDLDGRIFA